MQNGQAILERPKRNLWRIIGWGGAAALVMLPAVAMQFTSEVNWTPGDFGFAAMLLGAFGLGVELAVRKSPDRFYRAGAAFALLSAAASVVGRLITGTTAGQMIESFGYVNFYLFTTVIALPGLLLYLYLLRSGAVELSLGHHRTTSTSSDGAPHRLGG